MDTSISSQIEKRLNLLKTDLSYIFFCISLQTEKPLNLENSKGVHRGWKGIFHCFSKYSKLIFDLSGLIDQNESKISNFIPK